MNMRLRWSNCKVIIAKLLTEYMTESRKFCFFWFDLTYIIFFYSSYFLVSMWNGLMFWDDIYFFFTSQDQAKMSVLRAWPLGSLSSVDLRHIFDCWFSFDFIFHSFFNLFCENFVYVWCVWQTRKKIRYFCRLERFSHIINKIYSHTFNRSNHTSTILLSISKFQTIHDLKANGKRKKRDRK